MPARISGFDPCSIRPETALQNAAKSSSVMPRSPGAGDLVLAHGDAARHLRQIFAECGLQDERFDLAETVFAFQMPRHRAIWRSAST